MIVCFTRQKCIGKCRQFEWGSWKCWFQAADSSFGHFTLHFTTIHRGELLCLCSLSQSAKCEKECGWGFFMPGWVCAVKETGFCCCICKEMPSARFRLEDYVPGCSGCDVRVRTAWRQMLVRFFQYTHLLHQFYHQLRLPVLTPAVVIIGHSSFCDSENNL